MKWMRILVALVLAAWTVDGFDSSRGAKGQSTGGGIGQDGEGSSGTGTADEGSDAAADPAAESDDTGIDTSSDTGSDTSSSTGIDTGTNTGDTGLDAEEMNGDESDTSSTTADTDDDAAADDATSDTRRFRSNRTRRTTQNSRGRTGISQSMRTNEATRGSQATRPGQSPSGRSRSNLTDRVGDQDAFTDTRPRSTVNNRRRFVDDDGSDNGLGLSRDDITTSSRSRSRSTSRNRAGGTVEIDDLDINGRSRERVEFELDSRDRFSREDNFDSDRIGTAGSQDDPLDDNSRTGVSASGRFRGSQGDLRVTEDLRFNSEIDDAISRLGVAFETDENDRLIIREVDPNSIFARAGILPSDRIVSIAGLRAPTLNRVVLWMRDAGPGDRLPIVVSRAGRPRTLYIDYDESALYLLDGGRAALGVAMDMDSAPGAIVERVYRGSAAQQAGLRPGDHIIRFGGRRVRSPQHLLSLIAEMEPGEPVEVEFARRTVRTADIRLGSRQVLGVGF